MPLDLALLLSFVIAATPVTYHEGWCPTVASRRMVRIRRADEIAQGQAPAPDCVRDAVRERFLGEVWPVPAADSPRGAVEPPQTDGASPGEMIYVGPHTRDNGRTQVDGYLRRRASR